MLKGFSGEVIRNSTFPAAQESLACPYDWVFVLKSLSCGYVERLIKAVHSQCVR